MKTQCVVYSDMNTYLICLFRRTRKVKAILSVQDMAQVNVTIISRNTLTAEHRPTHARIAYGSQRFLARDGHSNFFSPHRDRIAKLT